ncbi:MAG: aminotransferase class I/II-fold pyridoxal phosphate-dependent enzyme [Verrucomicrobiota bacterium]|nr:aminotransferase class I/II-fold pyridoxal phosphate-dependent enzyme [Verrucomicrobiota bacterium]
MNLTKDKGRRVAAHLQGIPRSGIREFFDIVSTRQDVISLSIGEPNFVTPWHIREASIYALDRGATAYTSNLGLLELRRAIADYVRESFQIAYDPASEILVTAGVSEALDLAVRAVMNPGDEALYHEPCYVSYAPVIALAHGAPVAVATRREDGFRLTRARIEPAITPRTRVLLLNFPTNPTGAVLTHDDARGIAELAVERDLVVIADEIYSELTFDAQRVSVAAFPGMKERTIFLNGFSKSWAMTGFRVGFACAPPDLTEAMMKIHQYTMLCAPILSQKAALEALRGGAPDLARMRDEYRRRRNLTHAALNEIGLPCHRPEGAFYAFPRVGGFGMRSREFSLRLLDEEKVACVPGAAFGASGEGFMRCSFAADLDELREALSRIRAFVKRL